MKTLAPFALAVLFAVGCAEEPDAPADPVEDAAPAEVVTDPVEDAVTDTLMLDDEVEIDDADLEEGTTEPAEGE